MIRTKNLIAKTLLFASILLCAAYVQAGFMSSWMQPFQGPSQNISYLIVTGNYSKSRVLAELIQKSTGQPILLLPFASENSTQNIYFVPPIKSGKALKVPYTEMTNFINFLNPKMVLVIGNQNYVPDAYFKMISDKTRPVVRITSDDWIKNGDELGILLNLSNLGSDYKRLLEELQNNANYQRKAPVAPAHVAQPQPVVVEAPAPTPAPVVEAPAPTPAPVLTEPRVIDASQK